MTSGRAERVVLVLSGGGAKAAAHLGAVRALRASGVVPTRYVGTSMGAVIATGLAAGLSPDDVAARRRMEGSPAFAAATGRPEPYPIDPRALPDRPHVHVLALAHLESVEAALLHRVQVVSRHFAHRA